MTKDSQITISVSADTCLIISICCEELSKKSNILDIPPGRDFIVCAFYIGVGLFRDVTEIGWSELSTVCSRIKYSLRGTGTLRNSTENDLRLVWS